MLARRNRRKLKGAGNRDKVADRRRNRPTCHGIGPDVVVASDVNTHVAVEQKLDSLAQDFARGGVANIGHDRE